MTLLPRPLRRSLSPNHSKRCFYLLLLILFYNNNNFNNNNNYYYYYNSTFLTFTSVDFLTIRHCLLELSNVQFSAFVLCIRWKYNNNKYNNNNNNNNNNIIIIIIIFLLSSGLIQLIFAIHLLTRPTQKDYHSRRF